MIETTQETMTPKWAGEILDRHYDRIAKGLFIQRPISIRAINRYAGDMRRGQFKLTHQPIAFDTNGDLIDGQHRLEAVRKSGKSIDMMVSTGWPVGGENGDAQLIDVIDTGRTRSLGQMLHLHGQINANNVAASVRFACRVVHGACSVDLSYSNCVYALDKLGLRTAIDRISSVMTGNRKFLGKLVGPLAYYYTYKPKKALDFADAIFNHTATRGDAAQAFLKWFECKSQRPTEHYVKGICYCLRAWDANENVERVSIGVEAVDWLANTNPKLRDNIRESITRSR